MSDERLIEDANDNTDEEASSSSGLVARGDSYLDEGEEGGLKSELPGVDDDCWTQFVKCMMTSKVNAVSASNAVGVFEMMPRRLADLGVVKKLARSKSPASSSAPQGRTVWVAVFVPPWTADRFLKSPKKQYEVFCQSMQDYDSKMQNGEIVRGSGMSRSGALAVLHKAGPQGLQTWLSGDQFPTTKKLYESVAGIF